MAINITQLNSQLGAYFRVNSEQIIDSMFRDLELEQMMGSIPNVKDEWVSGTFTTGQVLQPYQPGWVEVGQVSASNPGTATGQVIGSATGSAVFVATPVKHKVRKIMHKSSWDDMNDLETSWLGFLTDESKSLSEWPLVRYIIEKELIPKAKQELDDISARGAYVAPTAGVPGAALTSVDGILTHITAQIAASNLAPIASGSFTSSTIFANVEAFVSAIPSHQRNKGYVLMMSDANYLKLYQNIRTLFGNNAAVYDGKSLTMNILNTPITVKGFSAFGSSNRFIYTNPNNIKKLYDKNELAENLTAEVFADRLYINFKFKRGYGFLKYSEVYVNDQA